MGPTKSVEKPGAKTRESQSGHSWEFEFSVFTGTYNQAHTLHRVYESLAKQTFRSFEWIVVDDGSTDNTAQYVDEFRHGSAIPISYIRQEHKGHHFAANVGVRLARGRYFLSFNAGDACVPTALATFKDAWDDIPAAERRRFSTVTCLCQDAAGNIIGPQYPKPVFDVSGYWEQVALRSAAVRWGVNRTDLLRRFPFPEFSGERHIPKSVVWNRMSREFCTRFIDRPLLVHFQDDHATRGVVKARRRNPRGASTQYVEQAQMRGGGWLRLKAAINFVRYRLHASLGIFGTDHKLDRWLLLTALAPGYCLYFRDRLED